MIKRMKLINVLVVLSAVSMLLIGCNTNEMKVFNGLINLNNMTSYESDTSINANVNVTGLSEEEELEVQQLLYMINNSGIEIHEKMERNEDQTKVKAEMDLDMNFAGMAMDTSVWVDGDFTGDEIVIKEIFQLPAVMKMGMPESYRNKEYFVIDLSDINESMEEEVISKEILKESIELSKEFQPIVEEFLKGYAKDFNFKKDIISYEGEEKIDGETVKVYQMKFDDETFKDFLQYAAHTFVESDSTENFIREYFGIITKLVESMDIQNEIEKEEMTQALDEMLYIFSEDSREDVLNSIDTFFDTIEDFNIIGEEGLVVNYKIDTNDNIVNTNGVVHLSISQNDIMNIQMQQYYTEEELAFAPEVSEAEEETSMEDVIIDIKLEFNQDIYNINEDIDIQLPELTEENSINYMDIFKIQQEMMNTQDVYNIDSTDVYNIDSTLNF